VKQWVESGYILFFTLGAAWPSSSGSKVNVLTGGVPGGLGSHFSHCCSLWLTPAADSPHSCSLRSCKLPEVQVMGEQ